MESASAANHHSETAWLLWLSKEIGITLKASLIEQVLRVESSVCSLIALDLYHSGHVDALIDVSSLQALVSPEALYGTHWLMAYEGGRRRWLGNTDFSFIQEHPCFGVLLAAGVGFYSHEAKIPPIFVLKATAQGEARFNTDEEIHDSFEFDNMDEEYFDSSSRDEEEDNDPLEDPDDLC